MKARRVFVMTGVVAVTLVAAAISYRHQSTLALHHGQAYPWAAIYPLSVDGLIATTGALVSSDRSDGFRPRPWAVVGFWIGVAVSVAANWLAVDGGGIVAHGLSAFPALAFLIDVEAMSQKPRRRARPVKGDAPETTARVSGTPTTPPAPAVVLPATVAVKPATVRRVPAAAKKTTTTAEKVARAAANNPDATAADLARRLRLGETTVRRHLAAITTAEKGESEHVNGHSFETVEETK